MHKNSLPKLAVFPFSRFRGGFPAGWQARIMNTVEVDWPKLQRKTTENYNN